MKKSIGFLGQIRDRFFKGFSITLFLVFLLSSPVSAENNQLINNEVLRISSEEGKTCAPPYKPSNIFKVIFNYSEGMDYISSADSACSDTFADELVETFRDSIFVSKGCLDVTIEDVEEAKAKRSALADTVYLNLLSFIAAIKV